MDGPVLSRGARTERTVEERAGPPEALRDRFPAQVEPALPAGTYTVEVDHDDFLSKRVEAVVKAGETTTIETPLVPL